MNTEHFSQTSSRKNKKEKVEIDDFLISEESFKPMTKGLGFHHETKKTAFKSSPIETKSYVRPVSSSSSSVAKTISSPMASLSQANQAVANNHIPSGLEAFYGQSASTTTSNPAESTIFDNSKETIVKKEKRLVSAPAGLQFGAWIVDLLMICASVIFTAALLVLASGIELKMYSKLMSKEDLILFSAAMFSIYYLLYFTILDSSATPGKTIFGIRLVKNSGKSLAVKDSFARALVTLLSIPLLGLPSLLDFQGKITDSKVVK